MFISRYSESDKYNYSQEFNENGNSFIIALGAHENKMLVSKVATNGEIIWEKSFVPDPGPIESSFYEAVKIVQLQDSSTNNFLYAVQVNLIASASESYPAFITGIDSTGYFLWSSPISFSNTISALLEASEDKSHFYVIVNRTDDDPVFRIQDISGNIINTFEIQAEIPFYATAVDVFQNKVLIGGDGLSNSQNRGVVVTIENETNLTDNFLLHAQSRVTSVKQRNEFLYAGGYSEVHSSVFIVKINETGSINHHFISGTQNSDIVLEVNSQDNLLYALVYDENGQGDIYAFDEDLTIIWVKTISISGLPNQLKNFTYNESTTKFCTTFFEDSLGPLLVYCNQQLTTCNTNSVAIPNLNVTKENVNTLSVSKEIISSSNYAISAAYFSFNSEVTFLCYSSFPDGDFELSENHSIQSPYLYVQAAGSDATDGSVRGIHLRWMLKQYLGDSHLPKGNYSSGNANFNKSDDYIRVYRAPYQTITRSIRFGGDVPDIVDHVNYLWVYHLDGNQFYIRFKNESKYDQVRQNYDAINQTFGFIQAYGSELIEFETRTNLAFRAQVFSADNGATLKTEILSVENNTLTDLQCLTARSEGVGSVTLEEENIRTLRVQSATSCVYEVRFELYEDFINSATTNQLWDYIGSFALSINDTETTLRLENVANGSLIHGVWPRFNDQATVNKNNYLDRWSGVESEAYGSAYYEYYDRRLKTVVNRYLELSESDPYAMENIPFADTLPDEVSQEDDMFPVSNLTVIQLAALDYHLARMLGLGHIDRNFELSSDTQRYMYMVEYVTQADLNTGVANGSNLQHLYLSLPTAISDQRLPIPIQLKEPVLGLYNVGEENPAVNLLDEQGYFYDGTQRFISLVHEDLPENITGSTFYQSNDEFSTALHTTPVYAGIEYKLLPAENWRSPELSNTADYFNYTDAIPGAQDNETVPILLPDEDLALYVHREREEGVHRYSSYGINWFSRSASSDVYWDVETLIQPANRLVPPVNVQSCLIPVESPLLLSSAYEQELLQGLEGDKTLLRITFNYHFAQEGITYQIDDEHVNQWSGENDIFPDSKEVFADKVNLFYRNRLPKTVSGKIKSITSNSNNQLMTVRTENYILGSSASSSSEVEVIIPEIAPDELNNYIGSVCSFGGLSYIVHHVAQSSVPGEGPVLTLYKYAVSQSLVSGQPLSLTDPLLLATIPDDPIFHVVENMQALSNWDMEVPGVANQFDFQVRIGDGNWGQTCHREKIVTESISGQTEYVLEKSRGIWSNSLIEEVLQPVAVVPESYDEDGNIVTVDVHQGMYKITFFNADGSPFSFSQYTSDGNTDYQVEWYKGIVRIHTQGSPLGFRKILEVVSTANVGIASESLIVYAFDASFHGDMENAGTFISDDPVLLGNQSVNFYPGYRVYCYANENHFLTQDKVLPSASEDIRYSIVGLQTVDEDNPPGATSTDFYVSKMSNPSVFFGQRTIAPEMPLLTVPQEYLYSTRPDSYGKSTFTIQTEFSHEPFGVQFYRTNDDAILSGLYDPATAKLIQEELDLRRNDGFMVNRWQNLLSFHYTYGSPTNQVEGQLGLYPEDESGYRFPNPDSLKLYQIINDHRAFLNKKFGLTLGMLNLGDVDNAMGDRGTLSPDDIVIEGNSDLGIPEVRLVDFMKLLVAYLFVPLTEIPILFEYVNGAPYVPEHRKQVIRDTNGGLLIPGSPDYDIAPMARKLETEELELGDAGMLFTDFTLEATSDNLYFYCVKEFGSTMQMGESSAILGPVKLVNSNALKAPDVRRAMPVLANEVLGILPGVVVELNAYPVEYGVTSISLYRTLNAKESLSIRTMDLVKTISIETAGAQNANIWKIKDQFEDVSTIPYGAPIYYRVVAHKEVSYALGSNIVSEEHPLTTELVPSHPSKLVISTVVESANPESPELHYSYDEDISDTTLLQNVILKWSKTVHNGKYHLYKMTSTGNWQKIHSLSNNGDEVQVWLGDTSLIEDSLHITDEVGQPKYHHFKVMAENSVGMFSMEEKILTIPNIDSTVPNDGLGSFIIGSSFIVG